MISEIASGVRRLDGPSFSTGRDAAGDLSAPHTTAKISIPVHNGRVILTRKPESANESETSSLMVL